MSPSAHLNHVAGRLKQKQLGNKTECTGFLARTTIKPETKAGLDKTESIMVRRPSLKWNFHASSCSKPAWKSIYYVRPARLFLFHFLLPNQALRREHSLSYLRSLDFLCAQVDQRFGLLLPHLLAFWAIKKPEIKKKEEKLGHVSRGRPPSLKPAVFYF